MRPPISSGPSGSPLKSRKNNDVADSPVRQADSLPRSSVKNNNNINNDSISEESTMLASMPYAFTPKNGAPSVKGKRLQEFSRKIVMQSCTLNLMRSDDSSQLQYSSTIFD